MNNLSHPGLKKRQQILLPSLHAETQRFEQPDGELFYPGKHTNY